jgi:hypothetical protein
VDHLNQFERVSVSHVAVLKWIQNPASLSKPFKVGSNIRIKFTVRDSTGAFVVDQSVVVVVNDASGNKVFQASYGAGVKIQTDEQLYFANWNTAKGTSGAFTISVSFSSGFVFSTTLMLKP